MSARPDFDAMQQADLNFRESWQIGAAFGDREQKNFGANPLRTRIHPNRISSSRLAPSDHLRRNLIDLLCAFHWDARKHNRNKVAALIEATVREIKKGAR